MFMATGKGNITGPTAHSPRAAADAFYERYPTKRICHVAEYEQGPGGSLSWVPGKHQSWRNITKPQINELLPEG